MTKDELIQWMHEKGYSNEWIADKCGVKLSTVNSWRSNRPIPAKAVVILQALKDAENKESEPSKSLPFQLYFQPDHSQFSRWSKAALKAGMTLEDWAFSTLEEECAKYEKEISNITPITQTTKANIRAAAGSPVNCDVIDWDGSNPVVNVEVYGLSMEPLFHDGDVVTMTHKSKSRSPFMKKGLIYLVEYDGGYMIKRYNTRKAKPHEQGADYLNSSGSVGILESLNPDFKPIDITNYLEWVAWYDEK